nr:RNA-directed DNA polymerase (reverse transcriptase) domain containing protein [Haemonchus contortus]
MDALCEKLDSQEGEKFVFHLAKARHRATQDIGVAKSVRNREGAILRKHGEDRRRWREYLDRLLNEVFARENSSHLEATAGPIKLWTEDEVRIAIGKMKVGKATGPDGVPIEAWKALREHGIKWLTRFLYTATAEGRIPDAWRRSTIVPIFKSRLKIERIGLNFKEQFGLMPERSTTDAIFIAMQIMEKYREKRRPCYLAFLDLEKAFDRLPREVLWSALRKRNVPEHLIFLVKDMYDGSTTTIRTAHGQTGAIDVTVGVHQGSALSPFLFLLTMDVITEELVDGPLKTILYADDIALIAESKEELQDNLQKWQKKLAENGLLLNVKKTKFLSSEEGMDSITDGYGKAIEKVQDFRSDTWGVI